MGIAQSTILRKLSAAGPYSSTRPLPPPFSQQPLLQDTTVVMRVASTLAMLSLIIMLAAIFVFRRRSPPGVNPTLWRAFFRPTNARAQLTVLLSGLYVAQLCLAIAILLSVVHLARDAMYAPSTTCWIQGVLHISGGLLSHTTITAIGIHSLLSIFRLKPVSQAVFTGLASSVWLITLIMGIAFPLVLGALYDIPFMVPAHFACSINTLYRDESIWGVIFPMFFFVTIACVCFPLVSIRLSQHTKRMRPYRRRPPTSQERQQNLENDRINRKFMLFPLVSALLTFPFWVFAVVLLTRPKVLSEHHWPEVCLVMVNAIAPTINVFLFGALYAAKRKPRILPRRSGSSLFKNLSNQVNYSDGAAFKLGALRLHESQIAASESESPSAEFSPSNETIRAMELAFVHSLIGIHVSQETVRTVEQSNVL